MGTSPPCVGNASTTHCHPGYSPLANGLGSGSPEGLLLSLGALAGEAGFSVLAVPVLPRLGPVLVSPTRPLGLGTPGAADLAGAALVAAGVVIGLHPGRRRATRLGPGAGSP